MALHQTECGMEYFTNDVMGDLLERSLETAELVPDGFRDIGTGPGSPDGREVDRLTIADREQSAVDDVTRIRSHPLVERTIPSTGSCTTSSADASSRSPPRPRPANQPSGDSHGQHTRRATEDSIGVPAASGTGREARVRPRPSPAPEHFWSAG